MSFQALTLRAPEIAKSIIIPVVVSQTDWLCRNFGLDKVEADVYALLDTGATNTSISDTLAASLGLEIIESYKVEAAGGVHTANGYAIDVMLRNMVSFTNIHAAEFVRNGKFDIIIGMDILMQGDLSITNAKGKTVVSFRVPPDTEHIDYVKIAKQHDADFPS
jgi:predicted aspartyl protease